MSIISVLLCTHNYRHLLPIATHSYLQQDYPAELVVVDDGTDRIEDMVRYIPGVKYVWHPCRNLAGKRNVGVAAASGDIIVHFDSDDWSGPNRVRHQVEHLESNNLDVVGYSKAFWYDTRQKIAAYANCGLWGAALAYRRDYALKHLWDETQDTCEDAFFFQAAVDENKIGALDGEDNFVATCHGGNADRPFGQSGWGIIANELLPAGFRKFMEV